MANVVASGDFAGRFAGIAPLHGFALLVGGQLRLMSHLHPPRLSKLAALAGASADQLALELGESTQDIEHQAAVSRGGIGPGVAQKLP